MVAWLLWKQGRSWLRAALARPRAAWMLALSGVLIGFNWGLYIWAVNAGHVVESSLGYFINPLLNVVLGVAVPARTPESRAVGFRGARGGGRALADAAVRPAAVDRDLRWRCRSRCTG